jgi:hypothetical protein
VYNVSLQICPSVYRYNFERAPGCTARETIPSTITFPVTVTFYSLSIDYYNMDEAEEMEEQIDNLNSFLEDIGHSSVFNMEYKHNELQCCQLVITFGVVCGRCRPAMRHRVAKFHVNNEVNDNQVIQRYDVEMKQNVAKPERHERTQLKTNTYKEAEAAPDGKSMYKLII